VGCEFGDGGLQQLVPSSCLLSQRRACAPGTPLVNLARKKKCGLPLLTVTTKAIAIRKGGSAICFLPHRCFIFVAAPKKREKAVKRRANELESKIPVIQLCVADPELRQGQYVLLIPVLSGLSDTHTVILHSCDILPWAPVPSNECRSTGLYGAIKADLEQRSSSSTRKPGATCTQLWIEWLPQRVPSNGERLYSDV